MGEKDFVSKTSPGSYEKATNNLDRLWKARFFYSDTKKQAQEMDTQFNWSLRIVPDAYHSDPKHALLGSQIIAVFNKRNNPENK